MAVNSVVIVEGRVRLALIFCVVVSDINALAGDVADVVNVTELAGLGVDSDMTSVLCSVSLKKASTSGATSRLSRT